LYQYTEEPAISYFPDAPFAQGGQNNRRCAVGVFNNTYVMNSSTVLTLRVGWNTFDDITPLLYPFDAHTLASTNPLLTQFRAALSGHLAHWLSGHELHGAGQNTLLFTRSERHAHQACRRTQLQGGADYRVLGVKAKTYGNSAGSFTFSGQYTGSNATSPAATSRNAIADLLLGYPSAGSIPINPEIDDFVNYFGAYAQDDFHVTDRLTVNYGLRLEHETGLAERNNQLAVGFDSTTVNP
jgi:hypothetical protein